MNLKKRLTDFFSKGNEPRFDDSPEGLNTMVEKRNWIVVGVISLIVLLSYVTYAEVKSLHAPSIKKMKAQFASPVEGSDFDSNLTKSYLQTVQSQLKTINDTLKTQNKSNYRFFDTEKALNDKLAELKATITDLKTKVRTVEKNKVTPTATVGADVGTEHQATQTVTSSNNRDALSFNNQPRYDDAPTLRSVRTPPPIMTADANPEPSTGIESFKFASKKKEHTPANYVPAGAFVTAVMTGGADANAGVNGTSDTAPVTFRAINNGFLPNGKKSHLKDCFFTASAYGEISSSRGIIRTDRMSCTLPNNEILDVPVQATAFNFGKNGVRGTAVMRNGKIIEMAGVSGIFTGVGKTAKGLSTTQSVSPLGTTSSINPSDALGALAGDSLESVGSKLSDYYIKLAEQYHPVIELNAGSVVNIVFLRGFSLDPSVTPAPQPSTQKSDVQQVIQLPNSITSSIKGAFSNAK